MEVDISIDGVGFFHIQPETESGREWYLDNVEDEGTPYTDSSQYAQDIAQGATDDGLVVSVNGYVYLSGGGRGAKL